MIIDHYGKNNPGFQIDDVIQLPINETTILSDTSALYAVNLTKSDIYMEWRTDIPIHSVIPFYDEYGHAISVPYSHIEHTTSVGYTDKTIIKFWIDDLNGTYYLTEKLIGANNDIRFPNIDTLNSYILLNRVYSQLIQSTTHSYNLILFNRLSNTSEIITLEYASNVPTTIPSTTSIGELEGLVFKTLTDSISINILSTFDGLVQPVQYHYHNATKDKYLEVTPREQISSTVLTDEFIHNGIIERSQFNSRIMSRVAFDKNTGFIHHAQLAQPFKYIELSKDNGSRLSPINLEYAQLNNSYIWSVEAPLFFNTIVIQEIKTLRIHFTTPISWFDLFSPSIVNLHKFFDFYVDGELYTELSIFQKMDLLYFLAIPTEFSFRGERHNLLELATKNKVGINIFPFEQYIRSTFNNTSYYLETRDFTNNSAIRRYDRITGILIESELEGFNQMILTPYQESSYYTTSSGSTLPKTTTNSRFTSDSPPLKFSVIFWAIGLILLACNSAIRRYYRYRIL